MFERIQNEFIAYIYIYLSVPSSLFRGIRLFVGDPVNLVSRAVWHGNKCCYVKSSLSYVIEAWDVCRNKSAEE